MSASAAASPLVCVWLRCLLLRHMCKDLACCPAASARHNAGQLRILAAAISSGSVWAVVATLYWSVAPAGNSMHIQTLTSLATLLLATLSSAAALAKSSCQGTAQPPARLQTVNGFLFSAGLDNINLFRLIR